MSINDLKDLKSKKEKLLRTKTKHLSLFDIDFNIFFEPKESEKDNFVLEKPVWGSLIEVDQERKLVEYYEHPETDRTTLLEDDGPNICRILVGSLAASHNINNQYYIANMIFEMVKEYPLNTVLSFESIYDKVYGGLKFPFGHFSSVLSKKGNDYFIVSKLLIVVTFLMMNMSNVSLDDINNLFIWCTEILETEKKDRIKLIILSNLSVLVKKPAYRSYFEDHRRIIKKLTKLTNPNSQAVEQILYQALNTLWVLSFNEKIKKKLNRDVVINLCIILHDIHKDKIVRLSLSLLRNILHEGDNGETMIGSGIMDNLNTLNMKKEQFGDEDITEDILYLEKNLEPIMNAMSSYDRFKHEILSGKLDPTSPSHKSERFWRENFPRFEENSYEVLVKLKEIIENEKEDPVILALACWDIGEFVRFHPRGKAIVEQIECKVPIMKLLNHEKEKVKGEALLALQKLMVTNWEYLQ